MGDDRQSVTAPRIGTGMGYFVVGTFLFAFGLFAGMAAASGSQDAIPFATLCISIAIGLIVVGFWVRLFGLVERRLIDIETALVKSTGKPPVAY